MYVCHLLTPPYSPSYSHVLFPPEFTRKIVEAVCFILLKEGDSEEKYMRMGWTRLQMIVADPKYNSREGT